MNTSLTLRVSQPHSKTPSLRILLAGAVALLLPISLLAQTAQIRHAPTLNGNVEGSIQMMTAESVTLNGGANITKDLLVPGSPTIRLNGQPTYGGTQDGLGNTSPSSYQITLNGSATLRNIVRRTDPVALPNIGTPTAPSGSVNLSISAPNQTINWATLRNLTLNASAGYYAMPAGNYGQFTANNGNGIILGVAGASQPSIYNFQSISLNSASQIRVVGPVIVNVAVGPTLNSSSSSGASDHPAWLTLNVPAGNVSLNSGSMIYGSLVAPSSTVTLNGSSLLEGNLVCDRLTINGNSILRLVGPPTGNQPPAVSLTSPSSGLNVPAPATIILAATATDLDGSIAKVEFFQGAISLGVDTAAPFGLTLSAVGAGSYSYYARATDNLGTSTDSSSVNVTVTNPNIPPTVNLTAPTDGSSVSAPASLTLTAVASDTDGAIAKVEFYQGSTKLGEDTTAPFQQTTDSLAAGTYEFSAKAFDNLGAFTSSTVITITLVTPNLPPVVSITAPADGTSFDDPGAFTLKAAASDPNGIVTKVEFFQEGVLVGEDVTDPYEFAVTGLAIGAYDFVARATDNNGSSTDSVSVRVTVAHVNQPPTVTLSSPANFASFFAPASITLTAMATDPDGSISRVRFYNGASLLGESSTPVSPGIYSLNVTFNAPVVLSLKAVAGDNLNAQATSNLVDASVAVGPAPLPFIAGFEANEGYLPGLLNGQLSWFASPGANVVPSLVPGSQQELAVAANHPQEIVSHDFQAEGVSPVFVDFLAKPVAGTDPSQAVVFSTPGAQVALVGNSTPAGLWVFGGNGQRWFASSGTVPTESNGRSLDWVRLTTREDYLKKKWDLFLNGKLLAADIDFADLNANALTDFSFNGHSTVSSAFDDFYAGQGNPLFIDTDRDGMPDDWELANGLNPLADDRDEDLDQDGLTNIQEYSAGTAANRIDTDGDGIGDALELSLGYDPLRVQPGVSLDSDMDGDGLTLSQELLLGTDPQAPDDLSARDSDGDKLTDKWELAHGLNPLVPADEATLNSDADGDGLVLAVEAQYGTDPNNPDTDGDGLRDDYEVFHGLNPLVDDGGLDQDLDGFTNLEEFKRGSDPTDYYNGIEPEILPFIGGDGSLGGKNVLAVRVTDKLGTPLINAPVLFEQDEGDSLIALTLDGPSVGRSAEVRTGPGGIARVFLINP